MNETRFLEEVTQYEKNQKRRSVYSLKLLQIAGEQMASVANCLALKNPSRAFLIGCEAALKGIELKKSALGVTSDDFEKIINATVDIITQAVYENRSNKAIQELLKRLTQFILITTIGLTGLAIEEAKKEIKHEQEKERARLLEELVVGLFFTTDFPKILFREMGNSLEASKEGVHFISTIWESMALGSLMISYAQDKEPLSVSVVDLVLERLLNNVTLIDQFIGDKIETGELDMSEIHKIRSFFQQIILSLENQDIDLFANTFWTLLEANGIFIEALKNDCEHIKQMFSTFAYAFEIEMQSTKTAVNFVG